MSKGKAVQTVDNSWDGKWPRYDSSRGYMLCETCWNGQHWDPPYTDKQGRRWPKSKLCLGLTCGCGCNDKGPKRIKFTGAGQTKIDTGDDVLFIGPKAEELRAQVQMLKGAK